MFKMVCPGSMCTFILLITSNFLYSHGEVESLTDTVESKETKDSESQTDESGKKSAVSVLPGEGFANENGKTSAKESSLKVSLEEKSVEIKQGDLGKTKEVNDDEKKEMDGKKVDGESEKNADEKKEGQDEEKEKEGEKLKEETGIDLKVLTDNDFEHLTQASTGATTGDWLVLFTKKNNCDECTLAEKEMKIVYERVKHKLNVAKVVEGRSSKMTFRRFDIEKKFPIISLFHLGKRFSYQSNVTVDEFIKFLEGGYQLASWSPVREPYTLSEYYLEESLEELKEMLFYKKNVSLIIFFAGFVCGISVTSLCGSILFHLLENFKDEDEGRLREQEASCDMATAKNKAD